MKSKLIVSLVCAMLGIAVLADSYTFTPGTVIPLKANGSQAAYVTTSGNMKVASDVHIDSTKKDGALTVSLANSAAGDYVLRMLGTADGYTSVYTLTVTDGSDYTRTVTVNQKNTKADTTLANSNLNASNSTTVNAQPAFLVLDSLPAGGLTLTFKIDSSSGNWAGNYGYFTIYEAASVPVLDVEGSNGNVLASLSSQDYISTCGTISYEGNGVAFGSSKHGAVAAFALNVAEKATVTFEYDAGSKNSANTSHKWVLLSNDKSNGVSETFTKTIAQTTDWWGDGVAQHYTLDFGLLPAGYYTLCCYVVNSDTGVWAGNFGNFKFSRILKLELDGSDGATIEFDEDSPDREVVISNNPTVDLMGHDLTLNVSSTTFSGTLAVTNSDTENTGVLTLKGAVTTAWLQSITLTGNVKLVVDGNATNDDPKFATSSGTANTHTGGTVFQNQTRRVYSYGITANFGTGALGCAGDAFLFVPSSSLFSGFGTINNSIEVSGTGNRIAMEGEAWGTHTFNFNGAFSGDGELYMFNGWQPDIHFTAAGGSLNDVIGTYKSLFELRDDQEGVESVGIGAKDWRVIKELWDRGVRFDWTMFACAPTLLVHPPELLDFVKRLKDAGVTLIDSAVFNGGFLMGSNMLDYREVDPERDAAAFAFRDRYLALCRKWGLDPAAVAVEYAFRLGFDAVALNTSNPKRVVQNAHYGVHRSPESFWSAL